MENATKALLIAASVLIAIVLIAVSIKILGSTKKVTEQTESVTSTVEVSIYNSKLKQYEGNRKSASEIRSLFSTISQMSANNSIKGRIYIAVDGGTMGRYIYNVNDSLYNSNNMKELLNYLDNSKRYNIGVFTGYETSLTYTQINEGYKEYISHILITPN